MLKNNSSIEEIKNIHNEITKAIHFLVSVCLDENGIQKSLIKTTKPLVMHSLKVAFKLMEGGYDKDIVIAGVLHDLLEDANVTIKELEDRFGGKVAGIVSACSFDESIRDRKEQYKELFNRTKKEGREALIVKTADILENSEYLHFSENIEGLRHMLEKWNYFLFIAKEISDEPIYKELMERVQGLNRKFNYEPN